MPLGYERSDTSGNTTWHQLTKQKMSAACLRPSMKISAGQMGQSYVELDGPPIISLATGQRLNQPLCHHMIITIEIILF